VEFPICKNSSNISKSGKLKVLRGRVWAGGLNPGHDMSVGGAFYPSIIKNTKRLDKLVNDIADVMVRNF
jgi:methionine salvage enolase-phosphatase E1